MRAGFAREKITPPVGTFMLGYGRRDVEKGCEGIHDDIHVHALYLEHAGERAVILSYDLCFFSRDLADRYRGLVGRKFDLLPRQVMLNYSHTHVGPCTANWSFCHSRQMLDPIYLDDIGAATVRAVQTACEGAREATIWAGQTTTRLPRSRRKPDGKGGVEWRPYPEGTICNTLPLSLFKDREGKPICLLYSVACHPSTISGWQISADYPGVASELLNRHLGLTGGGAIFLQGCGGDTKPFIIGDGRDEIDICWRSGTWDEVAEAGRLVANEVISGLKAGLKEVRADLRTNEIEMQWPLAKPPTKAELENEKAPEADLCRYAWVKRMLTLISRHGVLDTHASILLQGIKIAEGLRIMGLEGEAVAGLGILMRDFYQNGVTFPLGYIHGTQLYLPTEKMLSEKGYEIDSYYEYSFPAPLALGFESVLKSSLMEMRRMGID